jgi:hypothetical protein
MSVPAKVAPKEMSWWSPLGWKRQAPPPSYVEVFDSEELLTEARGKAGYEEVGPRVEDDGTQLEYKLFKHTDGHLVVELYDGGSCIAEFFVADEDVAPFFVEKYPSLIAATVSAEKISNERALLKTLIAFVRHGHGKNTIDQFATEDSDDHDHRIQNRPKK